MMPDTSYSPNFSSFRRENYVIVHVIAEILSIPGIGERHQGELRVQYPIPGILNGGCFEKGRKVVRDFFDGKDPEYFVKQLHQNLRGEYPIDLLNPSGIIGIRPIPTIPKGYPNSRGQLPKMGKRQLIGDAERKELLEKALDNLATLQLTDPKKATWDNALDNMKIGKDPLRYPTLWRWMQTEWGKEVVMEYRRTIGMAGDDLLAQDYLKHVREMSKIASGEIGEAKDTVAAFKALQGHYREAGLTNVQPSGEQAGAVKILIQQFSGSVKVTESEPAIMAQVRVIEG
jgi:hypothetical protein